MLNLILPNFGRPCVYRDILILSRINKAKSTSGQPSFSTPMAGKISGWCTILIQLLTHMHQDAAFN